MLVEKRKSRGVSPEIELREGRDVLMTITYYGRPPAKLVSMIELTSSRFQLAPGVRPGTLLTDVGALGRVSLGDNPTNDVEDVDAPKAQPVLASWGKAGCIAHLRVGPAPKAGVYARGSYETNRFRPGARIMNIEIDLV